MIKAVLCLVGLLSVSPLMAQGTDNEISHVVKLAGVPEGEGRFVRVDLTTNGRFEAGYYFCAATGQDVYATYYYFSPSSTPFHVEHLLKFSICQDETLARCQEFASDKYTTYRTKDGRLENDKSEATVDATDFQKNFQACEPVSDMDELVKQSIHASDRRFSKLG